MASSGMESIITTAHAPVVHPRRGVELLRQSIEIARILLKEHDQHGSSYDEVYKWFIVARRKLEKCYGTEHRSVLSLLRIWRNNKSNSWAELHEALRKMIVLLEGYEEALELDINDVAESDFLQRPNPDGFGETIFIVHGHDTGMLAMVENLLSKRLKRPTFVLKDEPEKGRTIIEKFTEEGGAETIGFAVILLTADDVGAVKPVQGTDPKLSPRARQNAILELGFFIAKLGRERVCALYERGVEIPSDYAGVLYKELDERESWKLELAQEIKAAYPDTDLNGLS